MSCRRAASRRLPLVATIALLLASATCGWGQGGTVADGGDRAALPSFDLASVDGRRVGPAEFAGRVVLYEFWATWCTPCHVQVEILKSLYPRARAAGIEFVAVATGEPEPIVREFLAKSPYPYPVLLDPDERLSTALEVLGLPTLVAVDGAGKIVWRQTGLTDAESIVEALAEAGAVIAD